MGPFGSDQCRHVDDFGAKKGNVDDFVVNKSSFDAKNHYFIDAVPKNRNFDDFLTNKFTQWFYKIS